MKQVNIVAVSGGVDSVVLLDMLAKRADSVIVVAHFDHGIRSYSADDARFVAKLAEGYGFAFESRREELGASASEELARNRRYGFLREIAATYKGSITTAHHGDDAVETVAINFKRGTGWRGLAVLDSDIVRPLLDLSKQDILAYAFQHHLVWHEDSTNAQTVYLRNRIRRMTKDLPEDTKRQLLALRSQQIGAKVLIDTHIFELIGDGPQYSRYFFTHIPHGVAIECLRAVTKALLTRPQLERVLLAIKTASPKTQYQPGSGITIDFTTRNFSLSLLK